MSSFNLAIVGGGPRALSLLQEIAALEHFNVQLNVTIFDPAKTLGAGNIYAENQPLYFRMNHDCTNYTAYRDSFRKRYSTTPSYAEFCRLSNRVFEKIPARSHIGSYLSSCASYALERLRLAGVKVTHKREEVSRCLSKNHHWRIVAGAEHFDFDHVVFCTGHGVGVSHSEDAAQPLGIYTQKLPQDQFSSESIAIIGSSLTAIDFILHAAHLRGIEFEMQADHVNRVIGQTTKGCPIRCSSGSGRLILPKPNFGAKHLQAIDATLGAHLQSLAMNSKSDTMEDLNRVMESSVLAHTGQADNSSFSLSSWLDNWESMNFEDSIRIGRSILNNSYELDQDALVAALLGYYFRKLLPYYKSVIDYGASDGWQRAEFKRLSQRMERIAFGPPLYNYSKVIALYDRGAVQFVDKLPTGCIPINAFLPSYKDSTQSSLFKAFKRDAHIAIDSFTDSIITNKMGSPNTTETNRTTSLQIYGRSVESWVVGHDSLPQIASEPIALPNELVFTDRNTTDLKLCV